MTCYVDDLIYHMGVSPIITFIKSTHGSVPFKHSVDYYHSDTNISDTA